MPRAALVIFVLFCKAQPLFIFLFVDVFFLTHYIPNYQTHCQLAKQPTNVTRVLKCNDSIHKIFVKNDFSELPLTQ